jgi:excisionase family DNA binding protein
MDGLNLTPMVENEGFWSIGQVCQYLSIKRSMAYSLVESGSIPFYRIGRLLRFKPDDVKGWMETRRSEEIDTSKRAKGILKIVSAPRVDVDRLVKKVVAKTKENKYDSLYGKPDYDKAKEEVKHGDLS